MFDSNGSATIVRVGLFIDSMDPGGAETLVLNICERLDKNQYQPVVLHFGNEWLTRNLEKQGIEQVIVPFRGLYSKIYLIPLFSILFGLFLRKLKIDILHSHLYGAVVGAAIATFVFRISHVGTLHDIYTIVDDGKKIHLLNVALRLGVRLVFVSGEMKRFYLDNGLRDHRNIRVIYNGTALDEDDSAAGRRAVLDFMPTRDRHILISVGRLVDIKGHDIILRSIPLIRDDIRPDLLVVGAGPMLDDLRAQAVSSGVGERVFFLGHRDDVGALLSCSDIFLLTSYSEGLSCSILEAMAAGLPVIATDVGSNKELVEDKVTGFLIPPGDPETLSETIINLISDEGMMKRMGRKGYQKVVEKFTLRQMVLNYCELYNRLIS